MIPLMPDENSFDTFGYSDYQTFNYWEHSPTWEDLFGDDFTDDLLDEDELDEAEADTDHSGEQAQ